MTAPEKPDVAPGDIAIIGLSGRFPGARTLEQFWHNLSHGKDTISRFTDEELLAAGIDPDLLDDPALVRAGGVLDDIEAFDPGFFGVSPLEAAALDPQQRVFLECAWESLEHAGYDGAAYPGLVGVFAGAAMSSYLSHVAADTESLRALGDYQILLGNDKDNVPTLVSYKLDLRGPSLAVQTACSTSLVAVVVACQHLLSYQCDMALAGGVRITVPQAGAHRHQDGGILSPDGRCRAFDARAQGTVGGSGVGIVVLKRLAEALADGDCVHAVIKGTAINNDGAVKIGYTAPSVDGQARVIAMAHAAAGIDPRSISFVEAHGTATDLGDPIEVAALTQAFRRGTRDRGFCALSSVKANVGHLDTAAGVAGLIKTVLALQHRQLPPAVHFETPNPKIEFADSPFFVNPQLLPWDSPDSPRRAGVSSFGIGGTNAHVVVQEAPAVLGHPSHRPAELLLLSARSTAGLAAMSERLAAHLARHPELPLADVAFTLQAGRRAFRVRRAVVCRSADEATQRLRTADVAPEETGIAPPAPPSLVFMFPGHGPQHLGMASGLYRSEPTFRAELDRCASIVAPLLDLDLVELLYAAGRDVAEADRQLTRVPVAHAALFAVEYALARLWMEWGVQPPAMIGHSLGEYVAACLAGVFSLEAALSTVVVRATLIESLPPGAMLAVPMAEADVMAIGGGTVSVAAVNGCGMCVASGTVDAVTALERTLAARGLETKRLAHTRAFHSAMLDPVLEALRAHIASLPLAAPRIPFVSGVTGRWITDAEATDPAYWMRHARDTVRFADGIDLLHGEGRTLLEVGPGQTLAALARRAATRRTGSAVFASQPGPHDDPDDAAYLLGTLGRLWLAGATIDWAAVHRHARRLRTPLPTYPFERRRCWIEGPTDDDSSPMSAADDAAGVSRPDLADWFHIPSWRRTAPSAVLPPRASLGSRWVVFADALGIGDALARDAAARGVTVALVTPGTAYADHGDGRHVVDPRARGDYDALLRAVSTDRGEPDTFVHLWSAGSGGDTVDATAREALEYFDERQTLGFESLLLLAQALSERPLAAPPRIVVGTTNTLDVTGAEPLVAANATILGLARVIPDELSGVVCRSVDIEPPAAPTGAAAVAATLLVEIAADVTDRVVALRGPHRWAETFEAIHLGSEGRRPTLHERGVYLITGGLGGIGLAVAAHLARTCRARLVLVGRSPLPPRSAWTDGPADQHDDVTARRIRGVLDLEALGAEVCVETADVADPEAMQGVIERTRAAWGAIRGVVHAAGVAGGRLLQFHTPDDAATVMAPKVRGALVLHALLARERLDFMLLCSSLTAIHGAVGQADYCAANLFLDTFAHQLARSPERRVVSVNWDTWRDVGMAVTTALPFDLESHRAASLAHGFDPADGVEAAMRVLGSGLPQVAVTTSDLSAAMAGLSQGLPADDVEDEVLLDADEVAAQTRPDLTSQYVPPRNDLELEIAGMWQALFSLDQVGAHDNFFELGGHSLLALQVIARLRDAAGVELSARDLFGAPTVSGLASIIAARRPTAAADDARLQEALALIEGLSEDEVRAMLGEASR